MMQHPGLIQQLPTLRSIGLAFLVCLFGLSIFTAPAQAFQDEVGEEEATEEVVEEAADSDDSTVAQAGSENEAMNQ